MPMELLSAAELSGYVDAAADVHTGDRFRWEGAGPAEFLLDRPVFGKPVFIEVAHVGKPLATLRVTQVQRTDRSLEEFGTADVYDVDKPYRRLLTPAVTHLRITGKTPWRARVIQPDELPLMDDETTGRGEACFRHTLGAKRVTVQGTRGGSMVFAPDCVCPGSCDEFYHHIFRTIGSLHDGDFREDATLPEETGILFMRMKRTSVWSVTVIDDLDDLDGRVGRPAGLWSGGLRSALRRLGGIAQDP